MAQFLMVHAAAGDAARRLATPSEALYRVTVAPARILGLEARFGGLAPGKPLTFLEIDTEGATYTDAETAIRHGLLALSENDLDLSAVSPVLQMLAREGLPWGAELTLVTDDVQRRAHRLENKVLRVTQEGQTVWERSGQPHDRGL
jgi:hypothetical protein